MRESNRDRILKELAQSSEPLTVYKISHNARIAESSVHKIIKAPKIGLEAQGVVKVHSEEKSRSAGRSRSELKSKVYVLTFRGLLEYLRTLEDLTKEDVQKSNTEVRKIIHHPNYNQFPFFAEIDSLEKWLGDFIYSLVRLTARVAILREPVAGSHYVHLPPQLNQDFSKIIPVDGRVTTNIAIGILSEFCDSMPKAVSMLEKIFEYDFSIRFCRFLYAEIERRKIDCVPNPALRNLIAATYEEYRKGLEQEVIEASKEVAELTKNF